MKKHHKKVSAIIALLAVLLSLDIAPTASAQVSVHGNNLSAVQVIEQIQKSTDYIFFYNAEDMSGISVRGIDLTGPIEKVLEKVFSGTDVVWRIQGKEVVLKKSTATVVQPKSDLRAVSGIVVDESDGSPLIGATVRMQGSDNIAISDIDGRFSINGVTNRTILEVSYVGYKQRDFWIGDLGFLEISLSSENELEGVVVVGAGTQKKVSVTGSIAAIKGDELKSPSSSLTSNLAGKLSGVIAVTSSGEPGSTSQFYIRGISTFGGRSTPLILLDGVEISVGDLDNLPAESIDNFSILKDASATAIYGARGANGVMLITTKSGTENTKARINASFEQSFLQPVNVVKYADGETYMRTYNEALLSRSPSANPRYSETQIKNTASGVNPYVYPDVDWYDLMFKKFTMSQRANVNISGGGSAVVYYMSIQMNHDGGILDTPQALSYDNNYNRWSYTFQNNIGYKITPYTKIDLRMNAQISNTKSPGISSNDIFYQIFKNNPVSFPAFFPEEEGDDHIKFGSGDTCQQAEHIPQPQPEIRLSHRGTFIVRPHQLQQLVPELLLQISHPIPVFRRPGKHLRGYSGAIQSYKASGRNEVHIPDRGHQKQRQYVLFRCPSELSEEFREAQCFRNAYVHDARIHQQRPPAKEPGIVRTSHLRLCQQISC